LRSQWTLYRFERFKVVADVGTEAAFLTDEDLSRCGRFAPKKPALLLEYYQEIGSTQASWVIFERGSCSVEG
jgi:hypothetical protein